MSSMVSVGMHLFALVALASGQMFMQGSRAGAGIPGGGDPMAGIPLELLSALGGASGSSGGEDPVMMLMEGGMGGPGIMTIELGSDPSAGKGGEMGQVMDMSDFQSIFGGQTGHAGHAGDMSMPMVDPFMGDILGMMDQALAQELMPLGRHHHDMPCDEDEKKFCPNQKSTLHCLGKHGDEVSEKCRKDVKKSVPFNCADEISDGCDGIDESIITCLTSRLDGKSGKLLGDPCKSSLEVTKSLIHKVNTMPSKVTTITAMNDTHLAATTKTLAKDSKAPTPWMCPKSFLQGIPALDSSATMKEGDPMVESPCCTPIPDLSLPKESCVDGAGHWNLVARSGPHGGMACCPPDSSVVSTTKTEPVARSYFLAAARMATSASCRSSIALLAIAVLFAVALRNSGSRLSSAISKEPIFVAFLAYSLAIAGKLGVPAHLLKNMTQKLKSMTQTMGEKMKKTDQDMAPVVTQPEYGCGPSSF